MKLLSFQYWASSQYWVFLVQSFFFFFWDASVKMKIVFVESFIVFVVYTQVCFCSVAVVIGVFSLIMFSVCKLLFSLSVVSDSLWPHGLQHARLPCPSVSPRVWSSSCPSSRWCHPTISSSVTHFSSCLQSFPASGTFPVSQLFISGDQSIGASAPVHPVNIQSWFPLGLTGLILLSE